MVRTFENPPTVFIRNSEHIHNDRLILSLITGNVYVPKYNKTEMEFEEDLIEITNLWAFLAFIEKDFFDAHTKDILEFYIKHEIKEVLNAQ
jgi:hypothetical protein